MSEINWVERLHHLRFSRWVMLIEKWFSVMLLVFLLIVDIDHRVIVASAFLLFLLYFFVHANHYNLEEGAGLPVQRMTIKF